MESSTDSVTTTTRDGIEFGPVEQSESEKYVIRQCIYCTLSFLLLEFHGTVCLPSLRSLSKHRTGGIAQHADLPKVNAAH